MSEARHVEISSKKIRKVLAKFNGHTGREENNILQATDYIFFHTKGNISHHLETILRKLAQHV